MERTGNDDESTDQLLEMYFSYGFQQKEILSFLKLLHKINISSRTLKRKLSKRNLYRRKKYSSIREVVTFLENEIKKSGQLHGYKWMHLRCIQNNLVVTQNIVRELLNILDPQGVEIRKRKRLRRRQYSNEGPNYLWHLDSYDKLKPYGICISGCIDGFSRHILWLKIGLTSSDPKVIAGYFLDTIDVLGGCPKTLRTDMGTENKSVEHIQRTFVELFRENNNSNKPSFIYGKSMHNQRIEAWWSILRKHSAQFWMNLFQELKDENQFDGSFLDKSLIQFCFSEIIQKDMDQVVMEWNIHKISKSRNSIAPAGRPTVMYETPSLYGARDHIINIPKFAIDSMKSECTFHLYPCDKDIYDLCNILMCENKYSHNIDDPYEAVRLYKNLRYLLTDIFL